MTTLVTTLGYDKKLSYREKSQHQILDEIFVQLFYHWKLAGNIFIENQIKLIGVVGLKQSIDAKRLVELILGLFVRGFEEIFWDGRFLEFILKHEF